MRAEAVKASEARIAKEEASRLAFADGQLGLDRYGLRETLVRLGVTYQSHEEYVRDAGAGAGPGAAPGTRS